MAHTQHTQKDFPHCLIEVLTDFESAGIFHTPIQCWANLRPCCFYPLLFTGDISTFLGDISAAKLISICMIFWSSMSYLVGGIPTILKKYELVRLDHHPQSGRGSHKTNSKPPTNICCWNHQPVYHHIHWSSSLWMKTPQCFFERLKPYDAPIVHGVKTMLNHAKSCKTMFTHHTCWLTLLQHLTSGWNSSIFLKTSKAPPPPQLPAPGWKVRYFQTKPGV